MTDKQKVIDSHVHLDMIEQYHPGRIQWLKDRACTVISWSYFEKVDSVSRLERCLKSMAFPIHQHSSRGLDCYFLAGVHPRCIPPDLKPEQIESLLKSPLDDPLCRGIGEIGLEEGNTKEQEIFIAQLEVGRSLSKKGKIIGIHTPRSNKVQVTEITLEILARFIDISSSIVIDHCNFETIAPVIDSGFWAGVTLSPAKTSWHEVKHIVSIYSDQIDHIMCNTDSGTKFFEDLVRFSLSDDLPEAVRDKLFRRNAARFYNLMELIR